jgi:hypothetical protein
MIEVDTFVQPTFKRDTPCLNYGTAHEVNTHHLRAAIRGDPEAAATCAAASI